MAGDKHRSSTKILLQASNVKSGSQHSTPFTKLIGIFDCQSTSSFNVNGPENLPFCLTQLDNSKYKNVYISSNYKHCQSLQSSTAISDNSSFNEGASYSEEKEK